MKKIIMLAVLAALPLVAQAEEKAGDKEKAKAKSARQEVAVEKDAKSLLAPSTGTGDCTLTETANINVNFNSIEKDVSVAGELMEGKIKEVSAIAKDLSLDKFDVQSMNYSLYPYNPGAAGSTQQWQISGNLSFTVLPATKGKDMLVLLSKKGYQPSLNVNAYRSGNCQ